MSVDLTLHVMIANLETLAAMSSASMPTSTQINQWLSGVSQSKEGVVLRSDTTPTFSYTPLSIYIHPPTKSLIPRTALPSSLTSPILFPLTLLISSLIFPLNHLTFSPCYALGHIPPINLLNSAPTILMGILQSSSSQLVPTRLMCTPWSTLPFAIDASALLTTLIGGNKLAK